MIKVNLLNSVTKLVTLCGIALMLLSVNVSSAEVGKPAPDFTLKSNTGKNLKLSEQVGNVLLINFWASWCGPCRQEMPLLETLHKKYEDLGFSIIAINVDENTALADKFLASVDVSYPILYDNTAQVSQQYNVQAMPTTFIVDRDGKVRFLHKGFKPGYEKKYEKEVKKLVRE